MKKSNTILQVRVYNQYFTRKLQKKYENIAKVVKKKPSMSRQLMNVVSQ